MTILTILKHITLIWLFIALTIPSAYSADDIVWQHHQYITKEIDGGHLIATINFMDDGKFKGTVKGTGNLQPCEARFWGKGNAESNPLYTKLARKMFFSEVVNEYVNIQVAFMSFEKRGSHFLMQVKSFWFLCSDLNYDDYKAYENKKAIPDAIRFYPKQ